MAPLRIVFMGTPGFAVPALAALSAAGHDIVAVYTQPPRAAGRGQAERKSEVHLLAEKLRLHVETPARLKDKESQDRFAALGADIGVVAAYGLILPRAVLNAPRLGCLNIHASLLPRWRGAAPIQRAIIAGDRETGITIMQMDEGLDTGAILMMEKVAITPATTGGMLHDALSIMGADLIVRAIAAHARGGIVPRAQPDLGASYAAKITRDETRIDWQEDAALIARKVRAFAPAPGVWFNLQGERIKILAASSVARASYDVPGTITPPLSVACGTGSLVLERVQREGRAAMQADEFLRGFDLAPDARAT